ncbi:unnamed protein product, partial [Didymodactylos carnosus]
MRSIKLERVRSNALPVCVLNSWFDKLSLILDKLELFNKPDHIFNCDESGFSDDPGTKSVVVKRETKFPNAVHGGSGKSQTTVLLCTSAAGRCLPPYILYKGKRLYNTWFPKKNYPGTMYNTNESRWMDESIFFDWFKKQFIKETKDIPRPLLLILDNHFSHISYCTTKLALDNQIHILALPPHTTSALQPLDVYTLKIVKTQWRKLLQDYYLKTKADNRAIPKDKILYSSNANNTKLPRALSTEYLVSSQNDTATTPAARTNISHVGFRMRRSPSAPSVLSETVTQKSSTTLHITTTTTVPVTSALSPLHMLPRRESPNLSTIGDTSSTSIASIYSTSSLTDDTNSSIQRAITASLDQYLKPTLVKNTKRKTMIERYTGESLTSIDALYCLKAKEVERERKKKKITNKPVAKRRKTKQTDNITLTDRGLCVAPALLSSSSIILSPQTQLLISGYYAEQPSTNTNMWPTSPPHSHTLESSLDQPSQNHTY